MHRSITLARLAAAVDDDSYPGFCTECGAERTGVEPDAEEYPCDECGAYAVAGAEQLLIRKAG